MHILDMGLQMSLIGFGLTRVHQVQRGAGEDTGKYTKVVEMH